MKHINLFLLASIVLAFVSCNQSKIEYFPCQVDEGDDWSFVDAQGRVVLEGEFESCPSYVCGNLFFVREKDDTYTLYKFDKKKPKAIMDDLKYVGFLSDGLLPICKKGHCIEVINKDGETMFKLDKINQCKVQSCDNMYVNGYLEVELRDKDGYTVSNLVDTKGKPLFKKNYSLIQMVSDDLFWVSSDRGYDAKYYMINARGEKQTRWKSDMTYRCSSEDYVAMRDEEGVSVIFDHKGFEVFRCDKKDNVMLVCQFIGDQFIYISDDYKFGLMNIKGETIIRAKYDELTPTKKHTFLARKGYEGDYQLLDSKGNRIDNIDDYSAIYYVDNFGFIGRDKDEYYVLDDEFDELNEYGFHDIDYAACTYIYNSEEDNDSEWATAAAVMDTVAEEAAVVEAVEEVAPADDYYWWDEAVEAVEEAAE